MTSAHSPSQRLQEFAELMIGRRLEEGPVSSPTAEQPSVLQDACLIDARPPSVGNLPIALRLPLQPATAFVLFLDAIGVIFVGFLVVVG